MRNRSSSLSRNSVVSGCSSTKSRTSSSRPLRLRSGSFQYGIGQEPAVEHQVDVEGHPVLEPERDDRGAHGASGPLAAEDLHEPGAELVGVELTGVDHQVGTVAQPVEQEPLVGDGVDDPPGRLGVAAAGALEPS